MNNAVAKMVYASSLGIQPCKVAGGDGSCSVGGAGKELPFGPGSTKQERAASA
jgi:hypothetical protein